MAESLNVVVDISHHNGNPPFAQAAAAGIVGVIHKATQGLTYLKEGTRRKLPPGGARTHDRVFRSSLKAAVLESDCRR